MIDEQCLKLSSIIWIAAKSNDIAMITIIDSNKPEKIIDTFTLGNAIIYAIGSIPGKRKVCFFLLLNLIKNFYLGTSNADYPIFDDSKLNETIATSGNSKFEFLY